MRRRFLLAGAGLVAVLLAMLSPMSVASAASTATVYVVHGIPKTPVDVYVDGKRALDDFQPGTSQGPVDLPAGPHKVAIFPADAADGSGSPLLSADADLPDGANVTLVASLDADGKPTVTPFKNDVARVAAGQARLVVRHTAAAPAVDVLAGGKPVIQGLTNPNEEELTVPAGSGVGRGGRGGQHRPGDRACRRGPQGGHGHLRARHRVAAGQEPRPGELHGLEPPQLAVRRARWGPVGCPLRARPARVGAGPRRHRAGRRAVRGPASRAGRALTWFTRTVGRRALPTVLAGLLLVGCGADGGPRPRAPIAAGRACPTAVPAAASAADPGDAAPPARIRLPSLGVDTTVVAVAWTSAARCGARGHPGDRLVPLRPGAGIGRRVERRVRSRRRPGAGPRRVLPPGRPGGGRPRGGDDGGRGGPGPSG